MLKLNIKSINRKSIELYSEYIKKLIIKNTIISKQINIPSKRKRFTLLKSPHVNKKAQENFQFVLYQKTFYLKINNFSVIKTILINKPKHLKITIRKII